MADTKKPEDKAPAATSAPEPEVKEEAAETAEVSDGVKVAKPFEVTKDQAAVTDYVVKPGKEHNAIVRGNKILAQSGDRVPLTKAQYASFKDKFWTVAEAEAYKEELEAEKAQREAEREAAEAEAAEGKKGK